MSFNLCYTVILSKPQGANIGIIERGTSGYNPTDLDWGNTEEAKAHVRRANDERGIDADTQLDYEMKSMFVWGR